MPITSALVLFAVIWFLTLFIVLPLRLKKRFMVTTVVALVIWAVVAGTIISGVISVRDIDWFNRMATPEVSRTDG